MPRYIEGRFCWMLKRPGYPLLLISKCLCLSTFVAFTSLAALVNVLFPQHVFENGLISISCCSVLQKNSTCHVGGRSVSNKITAYFMRQITK